MAVDTLEISVTIPIDLAEKISRKSVFTLKHDMVKDVVVSEKGVIRASGSFDHRFLISVYPEQVTPDLPAELEKAQRLGADYVPPEIHVHKIRLNGSVPKVFQGHNVLGGWGVHDSAKRFVQAAETLLDVSLPPWPEWTVHRVDWVESFQYKDEEDCKKWIQAYCANRTVTRKTFYTYPPDSFGYGGTSWSWKAYRKFPEFMKHDFSRLTKNQYHDIFELTAIARRVIRIECGFRKRFFEYHLGEGKSLCGLVPDDLSPYWEQSTQKIFKERDLAIEKHREMNEIHDKLFATYSNARARSLWGTWCMYVKLGHAQTLQNMSKTTFYRHLNEIRAADCALTGIVIEEVKAPDISLQSVNRVRPYDYMHLTAA